MPKGAREELGVGEDGQMPVDDEEESKVANEEEDDIDPGYQRASEIVVWLMIPILVCLAGIICHEYCNEKIERVEDKRAVMQGQ